MGWLRPEATHSLSVPPHEARDLPGPVARLETLWHACSLPQIRVSISLRLPCRPIQELLGYPLRYTPVSDPYKYNPEPGALAYRAAGAYAYNGAPDAWPSRLVPYAAKEKTHHSF